MLILTLDFLQDKPPKEVAVNHLLHHDSLIRWILNDSEMSSESY